MTSSSKRRILPSVTTLNSTSSSWRDKISEIVELKLNAVALFLTGLNSEQRQVCYAELEKIKRLQPFSIPFVHAVTTMPEGEFQYLVETFSTEAFNLHSTDEYPLLHPLSREIRPRIFIENTLHNHALSLREVEDFGGICFDLSQLEDTRRNSITLYEEMLTLAETKTVGANHISAVGVEPRAHHDDWRLYSIHATETPAEFEYLADLDPRAFSSLCAIELENPLHEQLRYLSAIRSALETAENSRSSIKHHQDPLPSLPYRPNVCMLVVNRERKLFLGERLNCPGIWQFPQGGVEAEFSLEDNVLNELHEELGAPRQRFRIIKKLHATRTYDFEKPPEYAKGRWRGQTQTFWLVEFLGDDHEINLVTAEQELSAFLWCSIDEVKKLAEPQRLKGYLDAIGEVERYLTEGRR